MDNNFEDEWKKKIMPGIDSARIDDRKLHAIIDCGFSYGKDSKSFIRKCLEKNDDRYRWAMNRIQWFVELADAQSYNSVKVFFLIAMAESNIKILDGRFEDARHATRDVKIFFESMRQNNKNFLAGCFQKLGTAESYFNGTMSFDESVDLLLQVRHKVVHGKNHYDFCFYDDHAHTFFHGSNSQPEKRCEVNIKYTDFRKMMIETAIGNIKKHYEKIL